MTLEPHLCAGKDSTTRCLVVRQCGRAVRVLAGRQVDLCVDLDALSRRSSAVVVAAPQPDVPSASGSSQVASTPAPPEPAKERRARGHGQPRVEKPETVPAVEAAAASPEAEAKGPWWQKAMGRF